MNALYLTIKPIYPTVDGGCVAMAAFLNHLIAIHNRVDHLTIETYKHPFNILNYPTFEDKPFSVDSVYINTKISPLDAFTNLFSSSSYNVNRFYDKAFENKILEQLEKGYDVIYLESVFLSPYIKTIRKHTSAKMILRAPNVEYKIWENHTSITSNPFKKWYLNSLTKKLKNTEIQSLELVDGILTISQHDAEMLALIGTKTPILNLPFSIESESISTIKKHHFFFVGAFNWQPNLDAVHYLIKTLFPKIITEFPDAKLHIAGSYTPDSLYQFQSDSIRIYGKVPSVKEFMKNHGMLLAPIFSGSGVRIKILEALSFGIPVIGSSIAIQGINSKACFIASEDEDYVNLISELEEKTILDTQKLAIEYINEYYHPTKIEKQLDEFIRNC